MAPPPPVDVRGEGLFALRASNYFWLATTQRPVEMRAVRRRPRSWSPTAVAMVTGGAMIVEVDRLQVPGTNETVEWRAASGRLDLHMTSFNTREGDEETFARCVSFWMGSAEITPEACTRVVWRQGCEVMTRVDGADVDRTGTCEGGVLREVHEGATRVMERRVRDDGFDDVGETAQCSFDFEDERLTSVVCVEGDAVTERWEFAYERTRWTAVGTLVDEGAEAQQSITVEWEDDRPTELHWEQSNGEIVRVSYVYE